MRCLIFLLLLIFIFASCNIYYKNKEGLTYEVQKIESAKRKMLKFVDIDGHKIVGNQIIIYVVGKSNGDIPFTDTLSFHTTGDGFLINN